MTRARTAATAIASVTIRIRPNFCAISLPEMETAMPTKPAIVNSTGGEGSHAGDPAFAAVMVRKVTPQARSAAISQV